ncbi:MAG: hypothetical protein AAGI17_03330 [Planctomycetota bacterium]
MADVCVVCGYSLAGAPTDAEVCAECGTPIERARGGVRAAREDDPVARRLRSGAELAWAGLLTFLILPVLGAGIESVGWWRLSSPTDAAGKRLPTFARSTWVRWSVRLLTLGVFASATAVATAVIVVYVAGRTLSTNVGDDALIGGLASVTITIWTLRHVAAMWLVADLSDQVGDPALKRFAIASGFGGAIVTTSGFGLIGFGVLVFHVALFPPFCLLLPLWIGGATAWYAATLYLLARVRGAFDPEPDPKRDGKPVIG